MLSHIPFQRALLTLAFSTLGSLLLPAQIADAFDPDANGDVFAIAVQADGRVLIGGDFTTVGGVQRPYLARVHSDGALDTTFNPGADGQVICLALQQDGRILVGGGFSTLAGRPRNNLGRLNPDGTPDNTFNPDANNFVTSLVVQPDGGILVGGYFNTLGGQSHPLFARLLPDGAVDPAFQSGAGPFNAVYTVALQPDGKILLGGGRLFTDASVNILRRNVDGTPDISFQAETDQDVLALAVQPDGRILVGGSFSTINGVARANLARLEKTGSLDTTFVSTVAGGFLPQVQCIALQSDGKILVGGEFTSLAGEARFNIGRLNENGAADDTFDLPGDDTVPAKVYSLAIQPDGRVLAGGDFETLGSEARNSIGRLDDTGTAIDELIVNASNITWSRGGASPEVAWTTLEYSTGGASWISLGPGDRIEGGWEFPVEGLPENITIRARGFVAGGRFNGSSWFVESVTDSVPPPPTPPEFRALWVDAWGDNSALRTAEGITQLVNDTRTANMNALVVQVRRRGDAFYNSSFEPKNAGLAPGFDPLADLLAKAHDTSGGKQKIEVHAWIVTYHIWQGSTPPPQSNHPLNLHPDWLLQDVNGNTFIDNEYTFDPSHPEVQQHTYNVCMDILTNYDVDGLNFDYIRYSGANEGYNPVAVARFNELFGRTGAPAPQDPDWKQFRRDQITGLLRKVYLSAAALKPNVKISADTITWGNLGITTTAEWPSSSAYSSVLQDWRAWMEEGILDLNIPMNYYRHHDPFGLGHDLAYYNWSTFAKDHKYSRHLAIGPGIYLNTVSNALHQMRHTREPSANGNAAEGVVGYVYKQTNNENVPTATFLDALVQPSDYDPITPPMFAEPASVPVMPWKTAPTNGHLKGFVYLIDTSTPLDGAQVTLSGPVTRTLTNDATGFYGFVDLPPGNYSVLATYPGAIDAFSLLEITAGSVETVDLVIPLEDTTPPLIFNVDVSNVTQNSAVISWQTDDLSDSKVEFSLDHSYDDSFSVAELTRNHSVTITGLAGCSTYNIRIRSRNGPGLESMLDGLSVSSGPDTLVSDPEIILDGQASLTGTWLLATSATDKFGSSYHHASVTSGTATAEATFRPDLPSTGLYDVYAWHSEGANRTTNAQVRIAHKHGATLVKIDQSTGGGAWRLIAEGAEFRRGTSGFVRISNNTGEAGKVVIADAVRFVGLRRPCLLTSPASQTVLAGSAVNLTASVNGTAPFAYQWFRNGTVIPGATNSTHAIAAAGIGDVGAYTVAVSNRVATTVSLEAELTVVFSEFPRFDQIRLLSDNRVELKLADDPGEFILEATEDFLEWTPLTNGLMTNGSFFFIDATTNAPHRFYRMKLSAD